MRFILFTMSLSGTVVFVLYMCFRPLLDRFCSVRWNYGILKMALFFFLFPVPWYKYRVANVIRFFYPAFNLSVQSELPQRFDTKHSIVVTKSAVFYSDSIKRILAVTCMLIAVALISIIVQMLKGRKLKYNFKQYATHHISEEKLQTIAEDLKTENKIHQKIHLGESEYIETPMVMGMLSPLVLLPEKCRENLPDKSLKMILQHELLHIKHNDLWFKFLGIAVIALHWYNPVSWFLFYEICCVSEMYCDEEVVRTLKGLHWKEYGELLLLLSTDINARTIVNNSLYVSASMLGSTKNITKRRFKAMKRRNNSGYRKWSELLSCVIAAFICMTATITTFAYVPAARFETDDEEDEADFAIADVWVYPENMTPPTDAKSLPYDFYFTDEQGNVTEITGDNEGRASCKHTFSAITTTKHIKNSKGGCKVEYYNAKKCSQCGTIKKLDRYDTETHVRCPH